MKTKKTKSSPNQNPKNKLQVKFDEASNILEIIPLIEEARKIKEAAALWQFVPAEARAEIHSRFKIQEVKRKRRIPISKIHHEVITIEDKEDNKITRKPDEVLA